MRGRCRPGRFEDAPDEVLPRFCLFLTALRTGLTSSGARWTLHQAPLALRTSVTLIEAQDEVWKLAEALRREFDPDGLLCPGRMARSAP